MIKNKKDIISLVKFVIWIGLINSLNKEDLIEKEFL